MNRRLSLKLLFCLTALPLSNTGSAGAKESPRPRLLKSRSDWADLLAHMNTWKRLISVAAGMLLLAGNTGLAADAPPARTAGTAAAIFAGGCFWCIEADFEKLPGVIGAESGYTAGRTANPTYQQVSAGGTGHTEAIRVSYDPAKVSYAQLVDYFWKHIDPTVKDRQFCDIGTQYRTGIYWQNEAERKVAEASRDALLGSGKLAKIQTEIVTASTFYPAEEYHQDYYKKNPIRYAYYRKSCGRDARVQEIWGGK